jgi:hypothetical protein
MGEKRTLIKSLSLVFGFMSFPSFAGYDPLQWQHEQLNFRIKIRAIHRRGSLNFSPFLSEPIKPGITPGGEHKPQCLYNLS